MDFTTTVRCSREIRGQLLGLSPYIAMEMLQTTVRNLIVEAMLPTREVQFSMTSQLDYYWLHVHAVPAEAPGFLKAKPAVQYNVQVDSTYNSPFVRTNVPCTVLRVGTRNRCYTC